MFDLSVAKENQLETLEKKCIRCVKQRQITGWFWRTGNINVVDIALMLFHCRIICLYIFLLMDFWSVSSLGLLWIKLLWKFLSLSMVWISLLCVCVSLILSSGLFHLLFPLSGPFTFLCLQEWLSATVNCQMVAGGDRRVAGTLGGWLSSSFSCSFSVFLWGFSLCAAFVRGATDWNRQPWPGTIVTTRMSYLKQEVLVRNVELTSYHQLEELKKGQKERGDSSPHVLPVSQNPSVWNLSWLSMWHQEGSWVRVIGQRQPGN